MSAAISRRCIAAALILAPLLFTFSTAHSCPRNFYECRGGNNGVYYPEWTQTCYTDLNGGTGRMSYKWPVGFFQCTSWGTVFASMILGAKDEFSVTGVAPGTPSSSPRLSP